MSILEKTLLNIREYRVRRRLGEIPRELQWAGEVHFKRGVNKMLKIEQRRAARTQTIPESYIQRVATNISNVLKRPEAVEHIARLAQQMQERNAWHPEEIEVDYRDFAERAVRNKRFLRSLAGLGIQDDALLIQFLHPKGDHHGAFRHHLLWTLIRLRERDVRRI